MAASVISFRKFDLSGRRLHKTSLLFEHLLSTPCIEAELAKDLTLAREIESAVDTSIYFAFKEDSSVSDAALLFLHRILYRINRLNYFGFEDKLAAYNNDRSVYVADLRNRIEDEWLSWELGNIDVHRVKTFDAKKTFYEWTTADCDQTVAAGKYIRENILLPGYARIVQIESLMQFVQTNQLSRTLGIVNSESGSALKKVFERHSHAAGRFPLVLQELRLDPHPEAYLESAPWEVLANLNLIFMHSERKRFFLRHTAGLLHMQLAAGNMFQNYFDVCRRLQLPARSAGYWKSFSRSSQENAQTLLNKVVIPALNAFPEQGMEMLLGYELQKRVNERAIEAIAHEGRTADLHFRADQSSSPHRTKN